MSALAGLLRFDPRERVDASELGELIQGLERIGPDGGNQCLDGPLAMAYRAMHTTPESHHEVQPYVGGSLTLTWDGRLDNREEIQTNVDHRDLGDVPTDLELVVAAYRKWGTECFGRLIGDWAIALWDKREQRLLLARDCIGVRRLFYRIDPDGIAWCTTMEPLVLSARHSLQVDLEYIAGSLYARAPIASTPYREIRAVIPATFVSIAPQGKLSHHRYWSLGPEHTLRYASDAAYEEHLREVLKLAMRRRLRSDRPILAELSGGIDSSSIVCLADLVRQREPGPALETFSYYDPEEPSGDERPYFTAVEEARGRRGHHQSLAQFRADALDDACAPLPPAVFTATPGQFAPALRWAHVLDTVHQQVRSRIVLSGLGGDELLGGVQYEAPELADHLAAGYLLGFGRSLRTWSLARRKTMLDLAKDSWFLLRATKHPEILASSVLTSCDWMLLGEPVHEAMKSFSSWSSLSPTQVWMEGMRYSLASQLTNTEPPLIGHSEKRYPLLDRTLFEFLASIPRTQVLRAGQRRHLLRRALGNIVPAKVLFRRSKWFGHRSTAIALHAQSIDRMFLEPWHADGTIVDLSLLRRRVDQLRHGVPGEAMMLLRAISVEQWLRAQIGRKTIDFDDAPHRREPSDGLPLGSHKLWPFAEERQS